MYFLGLLRVDAVLSLVVAAGSAHGWGIIHAKGEATLDFLDSDLV